MAVTKHNDFEVSSGNGLLGFSITRYPPHLSTIMQTGRVLLPLTANERNIVSVHAVGHILFPCGILG